MKNFVAMLNGREVEVVIAKDGIAQKDINEVVENLQYGLKNSPWRKKVQGLYFFRLKFEIEKYELIDGVLHITAKGKNVKPVKEFLISNDRCNDLLELHWM